MKKIKLLTFFIILTFLLPGMARAIGIISDPLVIEDVLRGGLAIDKVTILNSENASRYILSASGDIAPWVTFYEYTDTDLTHPITETLAPARQYFDIAATFRIPNDTPNGTYSGTLIIATLPPEKTVDSGARSTVNLQVTKDVHISVTDEEIINLDVSVIPKSYDIYRGEALSIRVIYHNKGNVTVNPAVSVKIKNAKNTIFSAIFPYPDDAMPIKPNQRIEGAPIHWQPLDTEPARYEAVLEFLIGDKVVQKKSFRFNYGLNESEDNAQGAAAAYPHILSTIGVPAVLLIIVLGLFYTVLYFVKRKSRGLPCP